MLRRDDDSIDAHGAVAVILDRHLGFAVRAKKIDDALSSDLRKALHKSVRQHNGERHQLFGFIAGEAEHQALIARASSIHAHGYVRRLSLD